MMDEVTLGKVLDQAQRDLFRLETLPRYDVASDGGDFRRYLLGQPGPDMARKSPWLERLAEDKARGLRNRRVHVLRTPLSDYERYECEWGYAYNGTHEEIRILDLGDAPYLPERILEDFWVIDGTEVIRMRYTADGRFLGAVRALPQLRPVYRATRDALWEAAEDFGPWWNMHPEYHRDIRPGAA